MSNNDGLISIACPRCGHNIEIDAEALKNWPLLRSARAYCSNCDSLVDVPRRLFAKKG